MSTKHKKPDVIDLNNPLHRQVVVRAQLALLSQGADELDAHRKAVSHALEHWDDLTADL